MSTINWLFEINFAIFAVFLLLFVTELMGGVLLLIAYDATKSKVLPYIVPMWEVTGTFAAFWVVTADFAYPKMLWPVATMLAGLILVFLILIVVRNASISFAELIVRRGWLNERRLYQLYGLATLGIGLVVLVILSAIVSGAGVDLAATSFSLWGWVTSSGSLLYIVGVLFITVGLAPVFYDIGPLRRLSLPLTTVGVVIEAASLYLYSSSLLSVYFLVPGVLTVAAALLYTVKATAPIASHKFVFALLGAVIIFAQSYLVYPTAFQQAGGLSVDAVTTTGPMVGMFYVLTAVGAVVVGLLMVLYMLTVWRAERLPPSPAPSAPSMAPAHSP
jgi:cytochrome bd ubiquinol oxidase subunit II